VLPLVVPLWRDTRFPLAKLLRFVPMPRAGEPDCGTPATNRFAASLDVDTECASQEHAVFHLASEPSNVVAAQTKQLLELWHALPYIL
jgi:hypothetical protein